MTEVLSIDAVLPALAILQTLPGYPKDNESFDLQLIASLRRICVGGVKGQKAFTSKQHLDLLITTALERMRYWSQASLMDIAADLFPTYPEWNKENVK